MKKLSMEPADRVSCLQTLWENNKPTEPGPCGKNSAVMILMTDLLSFEIVCILASFVLTDGPLPSFLSRWFLSDVQVCLRLARVAL